MPMLWVVAGLFLMVSSSGSTPFPISPRIEYGTYIGGSAKEGARSLAVDGAGNVWVAGYTPSRDFPVTQGAFQTHTTVNNDDSVGFVTKVAPAGDRFVYSTFVGGSFRSTANGVAVDSAGNAVVVGSTCSSEFPVSKNALQREFAGGLHGVLPCDGFVVKLDATGSRAVYATYFGGPASDTVNAVAVNERDEIVIAGWTRSQDLLGTTSHGESDGFLALLGGNGDLKWIERFGGSGTDWFSSVAISADGTVWAAGTSDSADLACSGHVSFSPFGFVVRLKGRRVVGCVRFAGEPAALSVDHEGHVYVGGSVRDSNRSTGFALRLSEGKIDWYRRLGGSDETRISGISAGFPGSVFLCGSSYSRDFPVTAGAVARYPGGSDMVLLRLAAADGHLVYGTFLGGNVAPDIASMNNTAVALHADSAGNVWIAGNAIGHPKWITPNGAQAQSHGNTDVFVLKMKFAR
jgi:hypothetical protein